MPDSRENRAQSTCITSGQDADSAVPHRRWADTTAERLSPPALPGGYPNLLTADEPERVAHAYGPNTARLAAAKKAYHPGNVFTATPLPGAALFWAGDANQHQRRRSP